MEPIKLTATSTADSFAIPGIAAHSPNGIKERIYARVRPDLERIEAEIARQMTTSVPHIASVSRYIMSSGGKRLRPLLMILSARLCGYEGVQDTPLAVVFEFIHAASLLHDDVVDQAEFRRGRPAANQLWGNPSVVLVGDFLYSKSFLMAVAYKDVRILGVLSEATTRMAEGEVLQLININNMEISEHEYMEVITNKTAVLISAACHIGAMLGGADAARERALTVYGHQLGMAFQLIDDTLDYTGDSKELGKLVGKDVLEGKSTLPLIFALNNGRSAEQKRLRELCSRDTILPEEFQEIREMVVRSGGIDYTTAKALESVELAKEALRCFPETQTRTVLEDIADYVVHRRS